MSGAFYVTAKLVDGSAQRVPKRCMFDEAPEAQITKPMKTYSERVFPGPTFLVKRGLTNEAHFG